MFKNLNLYRHNLKYKNITTNVTHFLKLPRKFFPRGNNSTLNSSDMENVVNKVGSKISPNIEMNLKVKNEINKEMKVPYDDGESEEEVLDEVLRQKDGVEFDPDMEKYLHIAKCNEKVMDLPNNMQAAAKKVFSKHVIADIREWSRKFLLNYSQNHACEPPINLNNLPEVRNGTTGLFANSEELDIKVKLFNTLSNKEKEKNTKTNNNKSNTPTIDITNDNSHLKNKPKDNINPIKVEYKPAQCVSYLHCRMPYTYNVSKRICMELQQRLPNFKPDSILDYGSGLGSSIWAAHDIYKNANKLAAVEPNKDMRKLGRFLTTIGELNKEILWVESLTMIPGTGTDRGRFDLIFLSHVLQELPTSKIRLLLLETLFSRLKDDGVLVVVEPGSPKGYRFIHDLREWVINTRTREEASIIAPCPHHMKCPLAEKTNDWCHFSQLSYKWDKSVLPRPSKEKQLYNEKFCYLSIKKGKTPNIVYKDLNDLEDHEVNSDMDTDSKKSFFWERLLRPVIKKQKHSILDMCTTQGKFERRIIARSHGTLGGYKTSKKLNWGDLWYVPYWIPNKFRKERLRGKRLW